MCLRGQVCTHAQSCRPGIYPWTPRTHALAPWVPDTSRWPRESQQGMQHKAARAATTPYSGCSQPDSPSALRAPAAAAAAVRGRHSACRSALRASIRVDSQERASGAGGVRSPQRQPGPSLPGGSSPQGDSGGAEQPVAGGRACRQHGGAAPQAELRAQPAGAVRPRMLPDAASHCQEASQSAPLPTQLLLHEGHGLLRGL